MKCLAQSKFSIYRNKPTRTTDVTSATLSLGVRDERTELTVKQALRAAPLQQPKTAEDVLTVMGEVPATYHASLTGSHSTRLAPVVLSFMED